MKRSVLIGVVSAATLSTLAFAQTNAAPAPTTNPPAKTMQEGTQAKALSLRQDVLSSLSKAGFTDVSVKANSFVVQAKDKEGHPVTMLLTPNSFTEVMDLQSKTQPSTRAFIVAVSGILGMGDHYVAVRPSAINLSYNNSDKKWHAEMNANVDQLKAAPEYKYHSNS